ncbi:hypothetical protein ABIA16_003579 [Sinorhizobium fredii]
MQDFDLDSELLKEFRRQVRDTGSGRFHDPQYQFAVTVGPTKHGHMIKVEDTTKRWWGREIVKHEHPLDKRSPIADNGPATVAIMILQMVIEGKLWPR